MPHHHAMRRGAGNPRDGTGLAAAAHLVERGLTPLVLEQGPAAAAVRGWSHVRLFSTWAELTDPAAKELLAPTGWTY